MPQHSLSNEERNSIAFVKSCAGWLIVCAGIVSLIHTPEWYHRLEEKLEFALFAGCKLGNNLL